MFRASDRDTESKISRIETIALKIALIYVVIGALWILASDKLLMVLIDDPIALTELQIVKGWLFITSTGLVLYYLIARDINQLRRSEEINMELASERTRLFEEVKRTNEALKENLAQLARKNRYETIIRTVTESVHRSIDFQDVLENAVEAMITSIDKVDNIAIYLVEGEKAVMKSTRRSPDWFIERAGIIPYPKGFTWKTIMEGKPRYCPDSGKDEFMGSAGRELGIKSYLSMPIAFEGKMVGAININSFQKNAFDEEELKLLETVRQQIEMAMNNAKQAEALRRSEEEIRKINEELEKRVMERTTQLEAANKELEAFSYSVSHDLRAPLRAIDGFSRILIEDYHDKLDDEGKRLLNVIRNSTQNMGQLIDDLLSFSRLGRQEIKLSRIDMESLVEAVFEELKRTVGERRVEVRINALPPAEGDRAMIRQVLVNLLSNSIKFTRPKERAVIEIGGFVEEEENLYYVKDNGVGFDMRYVDKLFGVFQRLHSQGEFEGTGVGLALVQRIVHRHGGRVWAEGSVGEGATFYFTFPRKEGKA